MSAITLLMMNLILSPVFAASMDVVVRDGDRLVVKGFEAQVTLNAASTGILRISGVDESSGEGAYVLTKKDNVIEISMNDYGSKKTWMSLTSKPVAQMRKIEISGTPVPVDISLRGGSVVAQRWSKSIKASLTSGKFISTGGSGAVQAYVQKGEVGVLDHTGKVNVDSYAGTMGLRNIQGDIDATLFSGLLQVEKTKGFTVLSTQNANSKVSQSTGTLQFENGKGSMTVQAYQGRIEGQNQDGAVVVQMAPDSEVDLKSKSGRVNITPPANSGASVNLFTVDGEIIVPNELKVNRYSSEKSVRGRLRGDTPRGSIVVRSQDGTILVK